MRPPIWPAKTQCGKTLPRYHVATTTHDTYSTVPSGPKSSKSVHQRNRSDCLVHFFHQNAVSWPHCGCVCASQRDACLTTTTLDTYHGFQWSTNPSGFANDVTNSMTSYSKQNHGSCLAPLYPLCLCLTGVPYDCTTHDECLSRCAFVYGSQSP